jgi:hypothetical protein
MWTVSRVGGAFVGPYRADSTDDALAQAMQLGSVTQGPRNGPGGPSGSVELGHGHRLGARAAGAALDGVLHDKALGPVAGVGAVDFYEVRPEARMVLTQTAPTEPALPPRRLSTKPTKHRIS